MRHQRIGLLQFLFLFCGLFVHTRFSLQSADVFGLALQVEGEVLVTRGILEFEAQVEEVLMWEDEIETGDDGLLQLTFDSSFLAIGPNTLVSFEKEVGENGEELYVMTLEQGSFRSKILNMGSRQFFEVHTEGGKLRVHGTDFITSYDGESDGGFNVAVLQGRVAVSPPEGGGGADSDEGDGAVAENAGSSGSGESVETAEPVMLTQNQSGGVGAGGDSSDVTEMSFSDADALKNELPIPGDGDQGLVMTDLGIENVEVESFVEDVKEVQNDSVTVVPESVAAEVEAVQQQIIRDTIQSIELTIKGGIDSGI